MLYIVELVLFWAKFQLITVIANHLIKFLLSFSCFGY